jgi:2-polyprenyl-6-methoxyphenol hydroxylase-like FAD-dependent oxidoreductase
MEAAVRAKTAQMEGINFVHENGRPFATMKPTGDPNRQALISEFEIFRGDLAQILFDMTKDNERIRYHFGEQVASMQPKSGDDGPITVEFANSLPPSEYDLVVACDGAASRTRAIGLACGVRDHVVPLNCWAAYFSLDQDLLGGSKMGQFYSAVGGRAFGVGPDPAGVNRVFALSTYPCKDRDATESFRNAMKQGDEALKRYVAQRFQDVGWKTEDILKSMMKSEDFYASEIVQVKVPTLFKGRFVMVGDAGYAPGFTGGGTILALTGAYVLAGEVQRSRGDLAAGLRAYEERMRPIITDLSKIPPGMPGMMAPQTAWRIWLRNTLFAVVTRSGILEFGGQFFASAFGTDKYGLPEYELY